MRGRCFCGAVTFEIDDPVRSCVSCHCESCRRQCSAPFTTYIGVLDSQWRWTGKEPKIFNSSPGVERTFCDHCGSPLSFRSKKMSDVMHFTLLLKKNCSGSNSRTACRHALDLTTRKAELSRRPQSNQHDSATVMILLLTPRPMSCIIMHDIDSCQNLKPTHAKSSQSCWRMAGKTLVVATMTVLSTGISRAK
jgi:hypothetical protein